MDQSQKINKKIFHRHNLIEWLIVAAFAGFFTGCILLFSNNLFYSGRSSAFHEITYKPRAILQKMIQQRIDQLRAANDSTTKDTAQLQALSARFTHVTDTFFVRRIGYHLRAEVDADTLEQLSQKTNFRDSLTYPIYWTYRDTSLSARLRQPVQLPIKYFSTNVDFFDKYPGFAIWVLVILAFFATLFIIACICIYVRNQIKTRLQDCLSEIRTKKYWLHLGITLVIMALFAYVSVRTYYDGAIVKDVYFCPGLHAKVLALAALGYFAAAFCFAGFINTAGYLEQLHDIFNDAVSSKAVDNHQRLANIAVCYRFLKNQFATYFICTSVILSFVIFCTGSLYSAVNSMDFIKKIQHDIGFSPVRYDFVYVYGGLHTLLILLFYVPVQLKFASFKNDIDLYEPDVAVVTGDQPGKIKSRFAEPLKKATSILVAGSPILAGLMQAILDFFFNSPNG